MLPYGLSEPVRLIKGYSAFEEFFEDVEEAKVITFCDSPEHIQRTFEQFDLKKLEIIVGDHGRKDYREKLVDKADLADSLERFKRDGRLLIYTPSRQVSIHAKIYILKVSDQIIRILIGSPNFSKNAWGRQHETVAVFEVTEESGIYRDYFEIWREELKYCELFLEDLTRDLEKSDRPRQEIIQLWVSGKTPDQNTDPTRTLTAQLVESLQRDEDLDIPAASGDGDDRDNREEVIYLRGYDPRVKESLRETYGHPRIQYNTLQDALVGPRHAFATQHRRVYGIPIVNVRGNQLIYTNGNGYSESFCRPWPEDREMVREGLQHIEDYLGTVDDFADCDDPYSTKMHMFEALLYMFWAPLIAPYAQQLEERGISKDKNLPFLYIHGESGGGKSTFAGFVLRLISRHRVQAPEESRNVGKRSLKGIQQCASSFPFIIDDISKSRIEDFKDVLTGYWGDWRSDSPYPALVFTSNDSKPAQWFRNRAKRLQFDLLYDGRRVYQEKCTALTDKPNWLFPWFCHRYLELFVKRDEVVLDDDILALTREVFLELYAYADRLVPDYFPTTPAEEIHDPGLDVWREHKERGHIRFKPDGEDIVVEFVSSFEYHQILHLERELHNSIRRKVEGKTIVVKNQDRFREWYGEVREPSFWQRMNPLRG